MYAEMQIGDTRIRMADEIPQKTDWISPSQLGGTSVALHLFVEDVDAAFERAVAAVGRLVIEDSGRHLVVRESRNLWIE